MNQVEIKEGILEILTRYCRGCDRHDWELVRSCFHPDARESNHLGWTGNRDEFIDFAKVGVTGMIVMNHCILNHSVLVKDSTTVASEAYCLTFCRYNDGDGRLVHRTEFVRFLDRFVSHDSGWLIAERTVVVDWSRVDPVTAYQYREGTLFGAADETDPSYALFPRGIDNADR